MKTNTARRTYTHEGAPAKQINAVQALHRAVLACLLWEHTFYESGEDIATRIGTLARQVPAGKLTDLAVKARTEYNLRHAPLMLSAVMATRSDVEGAHKAITATINRADELAEILTIYAKIAGVDPGALKGHLPNQLKRGIANAFRKFDAYGLAKYDRPGAVRLRDAMFLTHPKPKDAEQEQAFKQLADGSLPAPDTWESNLAAGKDKKETFERLLSEKKLGYMALLRNLRNMHEAGVDHNMICEAIEARRGAGRVLPFRYVSAVRHAPQFSQSLDKALKASINEADKLPGTTAVVIDLSGSMGMLLSSRSEMRRWDAATALAAVVPAERKRVLAFATTNSEVPAYDGLAQIDAIKNSGIGGGTNLGRAVHEVNSWDVDRIIVITDEQSHDRVPDPSAEKAYLINVGTYQNGVGYGAWTHLDGFSEGVIRWIQAYESELA